MSKRSPGHVSTPGSAGSSAECDLREQLLASLAIGDGFDELLQSWAARATSRTGRSETAALRSITRRINRSFGTFPTNDINPLLVQAYAQARVDDGRSVRTVENHLRVLRRVFAHGVRVGVVTDNPAAGIKVPTPEVRGGVRLEVGSKSRRRQRPSTPEASAIGRPTPAAGSPKRPAAGPNSMALLPKPPTGGPTAQPKREESQPKAGTGGPGGWCYVPIGQPLPLAGPRYDVLAKEIQPVDAEGTEDPALRGASR